jgi:hypothetical protein
MSCVAFGVKLFNIGIYDHALCPFVLKINRGHLLAKTNAPVKFNEGQ